MLDDLLLLEGATDALVQGQANGLAGIGPFEFVYGIPNASIINAAFAYPGPFGARFSDTLRGAWYCAPERETSIAEVLYHRTKRLADIVVPQAEQGRPESDVGVYHDWLAEIQADLHTLKPQKMYSEALQPEPVPACWQASQQFARTLLYAGSGGLCYPSVRRPGHPCVACFRPALVYRVRRDARLELQLTATPEGYLAAVREL